MERDIPVGTHGTQRRDMSRLRTMHEKNGSNKEPCNQNQMEPEQVEHVSQTELVEPAITNNQ